MGAVFFLLILKMQWFQQEDVPQITKDMWVEGDQAEASELMAVSCTMCVVLNVVGQRIADYFKQFIQLWSYTVHDEILWLHPNSVPSSVFSPPENWAPHTAAPSAHAQAHSLPVGTATCKTLLVSLKYMYNIPETYLQISNHIDFSVMGLCAVAVDFHHKNKSAWWVIKGAKLPTLLIFLLFFHSIYPLL